MRGVVKTACALGTGLAVATLVALEGKEVVVLHTTDATGVTHTTRTWLAAEPEGTVLIEAATPERPFLRDLAVNPTLELERGGGRSHCHASVLPNPDGHKRVRRLLREQYGWADAWIALVADTHDSVAVRVRCE
jgi:hypothetical protein